MTFGTTLVIGGVYPRLRVGRGKLHAPACLSSGKAFPMSVCSKRLDSSQKSAGSTG